MIQVRIGERWVQRGQVQDCDPSLTGVGEAVPLELRFYLVGCLSVPQCFCQGSRIPREKPLQKLGLCKVFLRVYTLSSINVSEHFGQTWYQAKDDGS